MKFLDKSGITHLWSVIKTNFLQIPTNHQTASVGTVLAKTSTGSEWRSVPDLSGNVVGGFLSEYPFTIEMLLSKSTLTSIFEFTPLPGQSRKLVHSDFKHAFNIERIEIQKLSDSRYTLHFKAATQSSLLEIESIADSLRFNNWPGFKSQTIEDGKMHDLLSSTFKLDKGHKFQINGSDSGAEPIELLSMDDCSGECTFVADYMINEIVNLTLDLALTFETATGTNDLKALYNTLGIRHPNPNDPILLLNNFETILQNSSVVPSIRLYAESTQDNDGCLNLYSIIYK